MAKLSDTNYEGDRELIGTRNQTAAVLAINAASAATFKTTSAYVYLVDGVFKAKTALAAQAFSTGHAAHAIGVTGYYVVGLDAAGAVTTTQGLGALPDVANGVCPVGIIKVVANSVAFVPGTTALDNAGLTVTYTDIAVLPSVAP